MIRLDRVSLSALFVVILLTACQSTSSQSVYDFLSNDDCVNSILISKTISLNVGDRVLVQSDGNYFPRSKCFGNVYISMNSQRISSNNAINWRDSAYPVQHSYNTIGFEEITIKGTYTFSLVSEKTDGEYCVGAGSNLIVFVNPATVITKQVLSKDILNFSFITPTKQGIPVPHHPLLVNSNIIPNEPLIALASGYVYKSGTEGDAMWGIYINGLNAGNNVSMWTVNDIYELAEWTAPLYTHAYLPSTMTYAVHNVSLDASAFPWNFAPNPVQYSVGATTTLITLQGGMIAVGAAGTSSNKDTWWDWICCGSNVKWPGCPTDSQGEKIAEEYKQITRTKEDMLL
eukprot:TRINITY_DN2486_c0_g1_i1.p1 TRINITY_DN2486_c0_g1~~TRINITY_DN2486_c0_g1_i1.p1  ORF type:complete len:344 (-),score=51.01 TRINITY_DN2486_c0_g1_i1:255-1286(-)